MNDNLVFFRVINLNEICIERCEASLLQCILNCEANETSCLKKCTREVTECTQGKLSITVIFKINQFKMLFQPVHVSLTALMDAQTATTQSANVK